MAAGAGTLRARVKRWLEPVRYLPFALGRPRSPRTIAIDPLARCNLACPLCPTGRGHQTSSGKGILSLALYCKILDQLPRLRTLRLLNWGEPLIHPQIDEIIAIAARRGITVHAHSHLSLKKDDAFFERLIDAGLAALWVSLDGASEQTYARYRVGGDFGLALANLERLARIRRRLGSKTPRIVWKFIVHRHNAHEVETARRMAREIGVEFVDGADRPRRRPRRLRDRRVARGAPPRVAARRSGRARAGLSDRRRGRARADLRGPLHAICSRAP